jgi:hypothetical protein
MERRHSYSFVFKVFFAFVMLSGWLLLSPARADTINYSGTTLGDPVFNRPVDNGADPPDVLSFVGDAVPFDAFSFQVTTAGLYSFFSTATDPDFWDNYTFLYVNSFDPTNPLTNVLIGNDDDPSTGFSGFDAPIASGVNYVFVTTGYADFDEGSFQNTIARSSDCSRAEHCVPVRRRSRARRGRAKVTFPAALISFHKTKNHA